MGVADLANTTVTLLGGRSANEFGDLVDEALVQAQGVPACIVEVSERAWDPASQVPRTVRNITGWIPAWAGVMAGFEGQQIVDEKTGDVFFIEDIVRPSNLTGAPVDVRMSLRRVSGPNV
jgi:hypothetical protein